MLSEHKSGTANAISAARNHIQTAPKPDWTEECQYDSEFKGENERHSTYLLLDRQIHAERNEDYCHQAMRLETMEAVQHLSQWRLQFEPQVQSITLHFIKIKRGNEVFEQLNLEKGHLFQREEGLNRFVIDGWFTYLQVLEDVRPGDILEWAYTIHTTSKILSEFCVTFQYLPEWTSIGKYQFAVRFKTGREMKWKTSAGLNPLWSNADGCSIWTWRAEKYIGLKREPNTPSWYVSAPWIQISDCLEWRIIAGAIADAWIKPASDDEVLSQLALEIEREKPTLTDRIDGAIQLIQDEYRYLSLNLEFGGQIPTSSQTVVRRRYGDCKDLSFLLANLLKRLGVQARPVLVNTQFRKSVGDVLPTPNIFNHVIVEFEADGKRRWIDPTIRRQGGGAFNRIVPDYGLGLPVDASTTGLIEQPEIPEQSNLYELHETIQLDTTGATSLVSLVFHAEGMQADRLRNEFETNGIEEMAKVNLQACANRFGWAKRIGALKFRDNRATNQFFMAEVYEIDKFLQLHQDRRFCRFPVPSHWIKNTLQMPEKKERRTPFALPYPCQLIHIIEVASPTVKPGSTRNIEPRCSLQNSYVQFNRTRKTGYGYWIMNLSVKILADSVSSDQIEKHREFVENVWAQALWVLIPPLGYPKPKQHRDFGELPRPQRKDGLLPPITNPANGNSSSKKDGKFPNLTAKKTVPSEELPIQNFPERKPVIQTTQKSARSAQKKDHRPRKIIGLNRPQITIMIVTGLIILFFILVLAIISSGGRVRR